MKLTEARGWLWDITRAVVVAGALLVGAAVAYGAYGAATADSPTAKAVAAWKKDNCTVVRIEKKQTCSLCRGWFPESDRNAVDEQIPMWHALAAQLGGADAIRRGVTVCE